MITAETWTEIVEKLKAQTMAELRKEATGYPVDRKLRKEQLVLELAECVWAERENEHSDDGHDDEPQPDCAICLAEGLLNEETKTKKEQATRRGGRTLIPGYTMNEARKVVASSVAESLMGQDEIDPTLEAVESVLMDAADDTESDGVTAEYGRVMNEYLRQGRRERYDYILIKLYQEVGRTLEARGIDRKTGLPKEGQA